MNEAQIAQELIERYGILALLLLMFAGILFVLVKQITPLVKSSTEATEQVIKSNEQLSKSYQDTARVLEGVTDALKASTAAIEGAKASDNQQTAAIATLTVAVTDGFVTTQAAVATVQPAIGGDIAALRSHLDTRFDDTASKITAETVGQLRETLSPMRNDLMALLKQAEEHKSASEERNKKLLGDIQVMIAKVTAIERLVTPPPVAVVIAPPEPAKTPETPADAPAATDTPAAA